MRMVASMDELDQAYSLAKSEALQPSAVTEIHFEKYLQNPKHIEVQIISAIPTVTLYICTNVTVPYSAASKLVEVALLSLCSPAAAQPYFRSSR